MREEATETFILRSWGVINLDLVVQGVRHVHLLLQRKVPSGWVILF